MRFDHLGSGSALNRPLLRGGSTWPRRLLVGALVLGMMATACRSEEPTQPSSAAFDDVLIELFGTTDTDAYLVDAERRAGELVVECMEEAGFEFQVRATPESFEEPDPSSLEQAQAQGFGIIAEYRYQVQSTDLAAQLGRDLNTDYLSTLTSAEIERFFITLDGVPAEPGQRQQNTGCNGRASEDAYSTWQLFSEALPNYTTLGEERDTHPDWVAARAEWRTCMIERGFDYAEPDAVRTDVIVRMRETVGQAYPNGRVPLVEVDGVLMIDPTVDALLAELLQFEQAAAVANVECNAPLADRLGAVEQQVQQEFVDRNRISIDELLQATS